MCLPNLSCRLVREQAPANRYQHFETHDGKAPFELNRALAQVAVLAGDDEERQEEHCITDGGNRCAERLQECLLVAAADYNGRSDKCVHRQCDHEHLFHHALAGDTERGAQRLCPNIGHVGGLCVCRDGGEKEHK